MTRKFIVTFSCDSMLERSRHKNNMQHVVEKYASTWCNFLHSYGGFWIFSLRDSNTDIQDMFRDLHSWAMRGDDMKIFMTEILGETITVTSEKINENQMNALQRMGIKYEEA